MDQVRTDPLPPSGTSLQLTLPARSVMLAKLD